MWICQETHVTPSPPYPCVFCVGIEYLATPIFTVHLNFLQHSNIQLTYLKGVNFVFKYCQFTQAIFSESVEWFLTRCLRKIQPKKENLAKCFQVCKIKDLASSLLNSSRPVNTGIIRQIFVTVIQIHLIFCSFLNFENQTSIQTIV